MADAASPEIVASRAPQNFNIHLSKQGQCNGSKNLK